MDCFLREIEQVPIVSAIATLTNEVDALQTELRNLENSPSTRSLVIEAISKLNEVLVLKRKEYDEILQNLMGKEASEIALAGIIAEVVHSYEGLTLSSAPAPAPTSM